MIYRSVNHTVIAQVPDGARAVLDVGCGGGDFGAQLKATRDCHVVGITHDTQEAAVAGRVLDAVLVIDLDRYDPKQLGCFDVIVCCHVLEHLLAPGSLLTALRQNLARDGTLLVALPNVLYWKQRMQFLRGRFRYTDGGLMDRTHLRFFDWDTAPQVLREAGFEVAKRVADGSLPLSGRLGHRLSERLNRWALRRWPGLFGHQFVYSCRLAAEATST